MRLNYFETGGLSWPDRGGLAVSRERNPYLVLVRGEGSLLVVILPSPV
jgi:hypothetical protein